MPGSLGIEAIVQAFKVAVHSITKSGNPVTLGRWILTLNGNTVVRCYRTIDEMHVDIHIQDQANK